MVKVANSACSFGLDAKDVSSVSFMEQQGARSATCVAGVFSLLAYTLLAHDISMGTFWCPFSRCDAMKRQGEALQLPHGPHELELQRGVFACCCFFLDIGVLFVHWVRPVHPKFILRKSTQWNMRLHMTSGTLQCTVGPMFGVLWLADRKDAAQYLCWFTACCGLLLHIPTALYLLTRAFGAVRIMIPGFVHATVVYAYTLSRLLLCSQGDLEHAFLTYWLVLHVYVFNRVVFVFLTTFNILAGARYTLSIILGLAIALPAALGWTSVPLLIAAIIIFNATFALTMNKQEQATVDQFSAGGFVNQAVVKRHFVSPEGCVVAPRPVGAKHLLNMTDKDRARMVFDALDSDGSGQISLGEIGDLLVSWGLPRKDALPTMCEHDVDGSGCLSFDEFYSRLGMVWKFAAGIMLSNEAQRGNYVVERGEEHARQRCSSVFQHEQ